MLFDIIGLKGWGGLGALDALRGSAYLLLPDTNKHTKTPPQANGRLHPSHPQWTDSGLETDSLSQPNLKPEEIQQLANDARVKARKVGDQSGLLA